MAINQPKVTPGMDVVDADGVAQGIVKEVRAHDFKIDRPLAPDVYVHFSDVVTVEGSTVKLKLSAGHVDDQSWAEGPPAPKKP